MTEIVYVGPTEATFVPALDRVVVANEPVEAADDVAESLLEQPDMWQPAKAKPKKASGAG